jgi:hypothetical protein
MSYLRSRYLEDLEEEREQVRTEIKTLCKQNTGTTAPAINKLLRRLRNIHCNINQQRQRWPKHNVPSDYRKRLMIGRLLYLKGDQ